VQRAERTCLINAQSNAYFVFFFCEPVVEKARTNDWDGYNWGYLARKILRDVMMKGIYGHRDRLGHYHIVVQSCDRELSPPFLDVLLGWC
jgi:hypothetical protein